MAISRLYCAMRHDDLPHHRDEDARTAAVSQLGVVKPLVKPRNIVVHGDVALAYLVAPAVARGEARARVLAELVERPPLLWVGP